MSQHKIKSELEACFLASIILVGIIFNEILLTL